MFSELLEEFAKQNIWQGLISFCHDKATWFHQVWGRCYTCHNYTYHRWHHWMCKEWHMVQDHILTSAVGCRHKLCMPYLLCIRRVWAKFGGQLDEGGRYILRWRIGVLSRTSSHMWGDWNLQMFLLMDGSLALMYMVSLMILVMLCASLPTMEKLSTMIYNLCCLHGKRLGKSPWSVPWAFPPKVLANSPINPSSQSSLSHL